MVAPNTKKPISWDIDTYINHIVPRPRLHALPRPISHFLGYRSSTPKTPISQPYVWFWSFLGAFIGIILSSLFFRIPHLINLTTSTSNTSEIPTHLIIIGSLGATAILEYNTITSPLAQPRNAIFGQGISALIGVAIIRLFGLVHDEQRLNDLRFVAGALAVGVSSAVMGMTKTVHPPAGATSLLAATSPQVGALGWLLVPVVMGASVIMVVVACVVNNIQRQFPLWWWTELPLGEERKVDEEVAGGMKRVDSGTSRESSFDGKEKVEHVESAGMHGDAIFVGRHGVHVPSYVQLSAEEFAFLEGLKSRFGGNDEDGESVTSGTTATP